MKLRPTRILLTLLASILGSPTTILAQATKPNILVVWGDDIGIADVSAYSTPRVVMAPPPLLVTFPPSVADVAVLAVAVGLLTVGAVGASVVKVETGLV